MLVVFVHGWSVTSTNTYGGLPAALVKNASPQLDLQVTHLYLGKYVSFADEVKMDDIARGMQQAIATEVLPKLAKGERFACITHSTGGPLVRMWIDLFYRGKLDKCPLGHLIMLAPANHGSALAQLGKGRLARMKFFAEGVEPGTGVLDWLELGSDQSWELNLQWLTYDCVGEGLYPFVLTGQTIDRAFYDNLNSYTDEAGSDGVVRVAAANMNYGLIRLVQTDGDLNLSKDDRTAKTALGVLPGRSHSGTNIGILGSVQANDDGSHPTVQWSLRCLEVDSAAAYNRLVKNLEELTAKTQEDEKVEKAKELFVFTRKFFTDRYCMLVIRLVDDRGNNLSDYDVLFTAGPDYDPNHLPPGFFVDRQRNQNNPGKLTYYIDYDVMSDWMSKPELAGKFGVRITARPGEGGFAYYTLAEHKGTFAALKRYFEPNQTLMVEVEPRRHVVEGVFRLTQNLDPEDFKKQPKGADIP
jgi:hypothetical protein